MSSDSSNDHISESFRDGAAVESEGAFTVAAERAAVLLNLDARQELIPLLFFWCAVRYRASIFSATVADKSVVLQFDKVVDESAFGEPSEAVLGEHRGSRALAQLLWQLRQGGLSFRLESGGLAWSSGDDQASEKQPEPFTRLEARDDSRFSWFGDIAEKIFRKGCVWAPLTLLLNGQEISASYPDKPYRKAVQLIHPEYTFLNTEDVPEHPCSEEYSILVWSGPGVKKDLKVCVDGVFYSCPREDKVEAQVSVIINGRFPLDVHYIQLVDGPMLERALEQARKLALDFEAAQVGEQREAPIRLPCRYLQVQGDRLTSSSGEVLSVWHWEKSEPLYQASTSSNQMALTDKWLCVLSERNLEVHDLELKELCGRYPVEADMLWPLPHSSSVLVEQSPWSRKASGSGYFLQVLSIADGRIEKTDSLHPSDRVLQSTRLSRNGLWLAGWFDTGVDIYCLRTLEVKWTHPVAYDRSHGLRGLSDDGETLFIYRDNRYELVQAQGVIREMKFSNTYQLSPDGKALLEARPGFLTTFGRPLSYSWKLHSLGSGKSWSFGSIDRDHGVGFSPQGSLISTGNGVRIFSQNKSQLLLHRAGGEVDKGWASKKWADHPGFATDIEVASAGEEVCFIKLNSEPEYLSLQVRQPQLLVTGGGQGWLLNLEDGQKEHWSVNRALDTAGAVAEVPAGQGLALSPDGLWAAAVVGAQTWIWNRQTGKILRKVRHFFESSLAALWFSEDSKVLYRRSYNDILAMKAGWLRRPFSKKVRLELPGIPEPSSLAKDLLEGLGRAPWRSHCKLLQPWSEGVLELHAGTLVHHLPTKSRVRQFNHDNANVMVACPSSDLLAIGWESGAVTLFQVSSWSVAAHWEAAAAPIHDLAFLHDGKQLVSVTRDGLLEFWEQDKGLVDTVHL